VRPGDTIFSISETFGVQPETILLNNYDLLQDDPHAFQPGFLLTILPIDGLYYEWQEADSIAAVAERFRVTPIAIVAWPGNRLDLEAYLNGQPLLIAAGSKLVIPGGVRDVQEPN
jgi:spore germination protein YaaH